MKKQLLLIVGCFFLFLSGCSLQPQESLETLSRPDVYWKQTWVIEKRETHIKLDSSDAYLEASCLINYQGDETAEDVVIIMASPLTDMLIDDSYAENFGTVKAGDKIHYTLYEEFPGWREKVPTAIFEQKLIDDFEGNSFVSVSWKTGDEEHSIKFFESRGGNH